MNFILFAQFIVLIFALIKEVHNVIHSVDQDDMTIFCYFQMHLIMYITNLLFL